jgi:hypothetical protein
MTTRRLLPLVSLVVISLVLWRGLPTNVLAVPFFLFAASVSGMALVQPVFTKSRTETYALAAALGSALWASAILVSRVTGFYSARYLVVLASLLMWLWGTRKPTDSMPSPHVRLADQSVLLGTFAGIVCLIPSWINILEVQQTRWSGYWAFHVDLPFQIGLVGETAQRIPRVYPFADDTDLRYTWLTHAVLGFFSDLTEIPAFDVVLRTWPVVVGILISFLVAVLTWRISANGAATIAAPVVAFTFRGPLIGIDSYLDYHPLSPASVSRDLGTVWLLGLSILLLDVLQTKRTRGSRLAAMLTIGLLSFSLAGGKGSMVPLVLVAVGGAIIAKPQKLNSMIVQSIPLVASVVAGLAAGQLLVVRTSGTLEIEAFSFANAIAGTTKSWAVAWLAFPLLLVILILVFLWFNRRSLDSPASIHIGLLPLVGIAGLVLFDHPGKSQIYFWMAVVPYIAIGAAVAIGSFIDISDNLDRFIVGIGFLAFAAVRSFTYESSPFRAIGWSFAVSVLTIVALYVARLTPTRPNPRSLRSFQLLSVVAPVVVFGAFRMNLDDKATPDTGPSPGGQHSVHEDQLAAYEWLREYSEASERFISNKHCISGSISTGDCYPRWFMASAIAERRTPVEGFSYTWRNSDGPYWDEERLSSYDSMFTDPTREGLRRLKAEGVSWMIVDRTLPHSERLRELTNVVFEQDLAMVLELPS